MTPLTIIISAFNEADRLPATLAALDKTFKDAKFFVGDDCSDDQTAAITTSAGAVLVRGQRKQGKGGIATAAARHALQTTSRNTVFLLCDGDLGECAADLAELVEVVESGKADLAVAIFQRRLGGGFGLAVGFARWVIRRRTRLQLEAPISGQRALSRQALEAALPFAPRFGMEIGMTVDVAAAGLKVVEVDLPLTHRVTGRTFSGFLHRGRQLVDFVAVYLTKRTSLSAAVRK